MMEETARRQLEGERDFRFSHREVRTGCSYPLFRISLLLTKIVNTRFSCIWKDNTPKQHRYRSRTMSQHSPPLDGKLTAAPGDADERCKLLAGDAASSQQRLTSQMPHGPELSPEQRAGFVRDMELELALQRRFLDDELKPQQCGMCQSHKCTCRKFSAPNIHYCCCCC